MSETDGGPAFISIRDYFAAHASAPTTLLISIEAIAKDAKEAAMILASWKYLYADAMMKERSK